MPDPPAAETRSFRAALDPEGFGGPVEYRWSPEPDHGQGTSLARYGLLELEEGTVAVSVETCGAFQSHVLELEAVEPVPAAAQQLPDVDDFRTLQLDQSRTDSWRIMRHMEMRLHDLDGEILIRLRATEGADAASTLGLHDAEGELIGEGLPGESRVIDGGDVALDLEASTVAGSGSEVTMNGVLRFGPGPAGTYTVEFGIVPKEGDAQEDDVLGTFGVLPEGCDQVLAGVTIEPVG